jgi:sec-independent protein translocase protein TatC
MGKEKEMSFLDHLEVLRWHLVRSVLAIIIFAVLAFINKDFIFDKVLFASLNSDTFPTYVFFCNLSDLLGAGDLLCFGKQNWNLHSFTMAGQFSTHIMTSLFAGFVIAFPYVFWEIWRFIKPALYSDETKVTRGVVFFTSILFSVGVLFGYYMVAPLSVNFLGSYQISGQVSNTIGISSYVSTITTISFANGLIFELPMLVYFLTKIGLLTPEFMKKYRKHSIVLTLILSAIITPPDVTSQILVSLPLIILYEFSIKISKRVLKNQNK